MLGLKLETDVRWVNIVETDIGEILTDHAYCEQKAASSAISLMTRFPEYSELVEALSKIVLEEMQHFQQVHQKILERGLVLGKKRPDPYIKDLFGFLKGGNEQQQLVERLLISAIIEARSCERFLILSRELKDKDLRIFYKSLMASEVEHYQTFLSFARQYGDSSVDEQWQSLLKYEGKLIKSYGKDATMHG